VSIQPSFQGEVQFRRYSDTSTQGVQVVLGLADRECLDAFIGKEGKRYMAVLVEIGDDEKPVPQPEAGRPKGGEWAKLAGMWCADPDFQMWAGTTYIGRHAGLDEATKIVREKCGIESRAELDHDPEALARFNEHIRYPFMKWMQARGIRK